MASCCIFVLQAVRLSHVSSHLLSRFPLYYFMGVVTSKLYGDQFAVTLFALHRWPQEHHLLYAKGARKWSWIHHERFWKGVGGGVPQKFSS